MDTKTIFLALGAILTASLSHAANFNRSVISEIVRDVSIISPATKSKKSAKVQDLFSTPDVLRTGPESRAEMIAEDRTVTRIGANTLFSFEPNKREINLQRGSVLFHSPEGKGGGTIKTGSATASVLGTTMIVVSTPNGGFKVILLEGRGKVATSRGESRVLNAGQMTFVLPGQKLGPVLNFQLREQVAAARLVTGFEKPLASMPKITAEIVKQGSQISRGKFIPTGLLAGNSPDVAYQVDRSSRETLLVEEKKKSRVVPKRNAVINGANLDIGNIFLPGDPRAGTGTVFLSRNIFIDAPVLDLKPFSGDSFSFISTDNLHFGSSTSVVGATSMPVAFIAGGTITNTPGILLTVPSPKVSLIAFGSSIPFGAPPDPDTKAFSDRKPLVLTDFALVNRHGDISVISPALTLQNAGFMAGGDLTIDSHGAISMTNNITTNAAWLKGSEGIIADAAASTFAPEGTGLEAVKLLTIRATGDLTALRTDFVADQTKVEARSTMTLKEVRFSNRNFNANRSSVALNAANLVDINHARFQVREVSIAAATIVLRNTKFAARSDVTLASRLGELAGSPNSGRPVEPGKVNFVDGVNHGDVPAELRVRSASNPKGPIVIKTLK